MADPGKFEDVPKDEDSSEKCHHCGHTEDVHLTDPSHPYSDSQSGGNPEACASFVSGPSLSMPSPTDASLSTTPSTPSSTDLTSGGVNWTPHIPDPLNLKDTVPQAIKFITHDVPVTVNYLWNAFGSKNEYHLPQELEIPPPATQGPTKRAQPGDGPEPKRAAIEGGPEPKRVAREAGTPPDTSNPETVIAKVDTHVGEPDASIPASDDSNTGDASKSSHEIAGDNAFKPEIQPQKDTAKLLKAPANSEVVNETTKGKGKGGPASLDVIPEETSFLLGKDSPVSFTKSPTDSQSLDTSHVNIQDVEAATPHTAGTSSGIFTKVTGLIKGTSKIIDDLKSGDLSKILDAPSEISHLSTNPTATRPTNDNSTERTPLISRLPGSGPDTPVVDAGGVFSRIAANVYNNLPEDSTVKTVLKVSTLVAGGSASAVCAGIYASGQPVGPTLHKWFKTAMDWAFRWMTGGDHKGDDPDDGGNGTSTTTMHPFPEFFDNFLSPNSSTDAIIHLTRNGTDYFYPY